MTRTCDECDREFDGLVVVEHASHDGLCTDCVILGAGDE